MLVPEDFDDNRSVATREDILSELQCIRELLERQGPTDIVRDDVVPHLEASVAKLVFVGERCGQVVEQLQDLRSDLGLVVQHQADVAVQQADNVVEATRTIVTTLWRVGNWICTFLVILDALDRHMTKYLGY